jgi:hypothetical protein
MNPDKMKKRNYLELASPGEEVQSVGLEVPVRRTTPCLRQVVTLAASSVPVAEQAEEGP